MPQSIAAGTYFTASENNLVMESRKAGISASLLFVLFPITAVSLIPMDRPSFENLVHDSLRRLPRRFKQKIRNISIEIEDRPSRELLRDMGIEEGSLFGLYTGVPMTEREWNYGNALPDRIVIYQRPIEEASRSPEEITEIVIETVMHEVGHYFGFDDEALYDIEDERKKRDESQ